jgi:integrase
VSATTYDVRVWSIEVYRGARGTRYTVRWKVGGARWKSRYPTRALAESFRAELLAASKRGEPFDVETGRPVSQGRQARSATTWFDFAGSYVDARWAAVSPKHRKGIAEVLTTATVALLSEPVPDVEPVAVRSALMNWGYSRRSDGAAMPTETADILAAVSKRSLPLADLMKPQVARRVLEAGATKVDGTRASGRTAAWKRSVTSTALDFAVEQCLLPTNPLRAVKWKAPRTRQVVDRRVVVNPTQARSLLDAVSHLERSGSRLQAFFAVLYFAGLRPEEAVNLRVTQLDLSDDDWGWLAIDSAAPEVGRQWTDSGNLREVRELKHRAPGDARRAPCPPELNEILRRHLERFGADAEGRLFTGERGGALAGVTYTRMWARARKVALKPEQFDSPLARRPYDLRHAAVSTWLNGGVAPTQVAEWAGHSVEVLLRSYAKCLDGGEETARQRVTAALRYEPAVSSNSPPEAQDVRAAQ